MAAPEWFEDVRRCLEDVSVQQRAHGYGDGRMVQLLARMSAWSATQPTAVGVDVTDEIVDRVEQAVGMGCTAWDIVDPKELIRAAAAALRTGGGES